MEKTSSKFPSPGRQVANYLLSSVEGRLPHKPRASSKGVLQGRLSAAYTDPSSDLYHVTRIEGLAFTSVPRSSRSAMVESIVAGMKVLIPENMKKSGYEQSPERQALASDLLSYQLYFNEYLDFQGGRFLDNKNASQRQRLLDEVIKPELGKRKSALDERLRIFPEIRKVIEEFTAETEIVEREIKKLYCGGEASSPFTLEAATEYKSLVNAIYMRTLLATILGKDVLGPKLDPTVGEKTTYLRVSKEEISMVAFWCIN